MVRALLPRRLVRALHRLGLSLVLGLAAPAALAAAPVCVEANPNGGAGTPLDGGVGGTGRGLDIGGIGGTGRALQTPAREGASTVLGRRASDAAGQTPAATEPAAPTRLSRLDGGVGGTGQAAYGGVGGTGDAAYGGVGGTGAPGSEGGIGGTGIVGTITGFASVCVSGVEVHYDEAVPLAENGVAR